MANKDSYIPSSHEEITKRNSLARRTQKDEVKARYFNALKQAASEVPSHVAGHLSPRMSMEEIVKTQERIDRYKRQMTPPSGPTAAERAYQAQGERPLDRMPTPISRPPMAQPASTASSLPSTPAPDGTPPWGASPLDKFRPLTLQSTAPSPGAGATEPPVNINLETDVFEKHRPEEFKRPASRSFTTDGDPQRGFIPQGAELAIPGSELAAMGAYRVPGGGWRDRAGSPINPTSIQALGQWVPGFEKMTPEQRREGLRALRATGVGENTGTTVATPAGAPRYVGDLGTSPAKTIRVNPDGSQVKQMPDGRTYTLNSMRPLDRLMPPGSPRAYQPPQPTASVPMRPLDRLSPPGSRPPMAQPTTTASSLPSTPAPDGTPPWGASPLDKFRPGASQSTAATPLHPQRPLDRLSPPKTSLPATEALLAGKMPNIISGTTPPSTTSGSTATPYTPAPRTYNGPEITPGNRPTTTPEQVGEAIVDGVAQVGSVPGKIGTAFEKTALAAGRTAWGIGKGVVGRIQTRNQ